MRGDRQLAQNISCLTWRGPTLAHHFIAAAAQQLGKAFAFGEAALQPGAAQAGQRGLLENQLHAGGGGVLRQRVGQRAGGNRVGRGAGDGLGRHGQGRGQSHGGDAAAQCGADRTVEQGQRKAFVGPGAALVLGSH
ncbi:hypothetical protein D3C71_1508140 [compost metagenome]